MKVVLQSTAIGGLETPLLGVPVFSDEGARGALFGAVDEVLGGRLTKIADEEGFDAERGKTLLVHSHDAAAARVLLIGAGPREKLDAQALRAIAAQAVEAGNERKLGGVAFALGDGLGLDVALAARFAALGLRLGGYRYTKWRRRNVEAATVETATLLADGDGLAPEIERALKLADGVLLARDLVNGPPCEITPRRMAEIAEGVAAEEDLEITVLGRDEINARGMNLFAAVGVGSAEPPRFVHMIYRPEGGGAGAPEIALVGKGITFDSGGYNIKPTGSMEDMKLDMGGAAAVIGAMKAIRAVAPNAVVHGVVAACENLVSDRAYKPGDVIEGLAGKTVEIMNTDAEGRLILADALAYVDQLGVDRVVDLATLTGACVVALGPHTSALFANDDGFRDDIAKAAERAGESMWPMPLDEKLRDMLKSPIADMKNVGERWGGAITAALFLSEFVGERTWAHLDIAGPVMTDKAEPSIQKGGTGFGVLTLLELVGGEG